MKLLAQRKPERVQVTGNPSRTVVGLDVLRLAAALLVVCYHIFYFAGIEPRGDAGISDAAGGNVHFLAALPYASTGWVGVDLFFVISGFVITMSAQGKTALDFAAGRFIRLFPALLFFSLLTFAIVVLAHLLAPGPAFTRWLRTITLFPRGPWIDGVIWTLTIEVIFYALIFLTLAIKQAHHLPRFSRAALGILALFWLAVALNDLFGGPPPLDHIATAYAARVMLLSTGPFFLLGMFAHEAHQNGLNRGRALCLAVTAACCLFIIEKTAAIMPASTMFHQTPYGPMALWLGFTLLCGVSLWTERRHPVAPPWRAAARRIGLMTYPLYLVHDIPGGFVLGQLLHFGLNRWAAALLSILLALLVSHIFATSIEPSLKNRLGLNRLKNGQPAATLPAPFRKGWRAPKSV